MQQDPTIGMSLTESFMLPKYMMEIVFDTHEEIQKEKIEHMKKIRKEY